VGRFLAQRGHGGEPDYAGLHIGFGASSRERVDEFWQMDTSANYYSAYVLDPDRNNIELVNHTR
jgi:hypothetical protein